MSRDGQTCRKQTSSGRLCFHQGGIAFVAIKGAFKVYFKQQQYLRQAHRKILNFPEQEEA